MKKKKNNSDPFNLAETLIFAPGMFWHVHHDSLIEYCYDYNGRAAYIRQHKPANEIEIRLRLFQPVKGKLPKEIIKACVACDKAYVACDKAWTAGNNAWAACDKAYAACHKAWTASNKVWAVYVKAYAACHKALAARQKAFAARDMAYAAYDKASAVYDKVIQDNMPAILKLHKKECPNCSWDGQNIVF